MANASTTPVITFVLPVIFAALASSYPGRTWGDDKGMITSAPCPYDCAAADASSDRCREWKKGSLCFVEVFDHPVRSKPLSTSRILSDKFAVESSKEDQEFEHRQCQHLDQELMGRPKIRINEVSRLNGPHQTVRGVIEGLCIVETGYYENGLQVHDFKVPLTRDFARVPFTIDVNLGKNPSVQVFNINGARDVVELPNLGKRKEGSLNESAASREYGSKDGLPDELFFGKNPRSREKP